MKLLRKIDSDLLADGRVVARFLAEWLRISSGQAAAMLLAIGAIAVAREGFSITWRRPSIEAFLFIACLWHIVGALSTCPERHPATSAMFEGWWRRGCVFFYGPSMLLAVVAPWWAAYCAAFLVAVYVLNARVKPEPLAHPAELPEGGTA